MGCGWREIVMCIGLLTMPGVLICTVWGGVSSVCPFHPISQRSFGSRLSDDLPVFVDRRTVYFWLSIFMKGKGQINNWKTQIILALGVVGRPWWLLNVHIMSDLFSYYENCKTNGKSLLNIGCVLNIYLQLLFKMFFTSVSIKQITLYIHAETHVGVHIIWSLELSNSNKIWSASTILCEIPNY